MKVDRQVRRIAGEADLTAADRIIGDGLARPGTPRIPSLSEERIGWRGYPVRASFPDQARSARKEFVAGRNEFTVNLALVTMETPLRLQRRRRAPALVSSGAALSAGAQGG